MLYDGIQLIEGSKLTNMVVDSGTTFPSNPESGELFYRTDSGNVGLYVYTGTEWSSASSGTVSFDTLNVKQAVRAATTANITLSGTQTVDGVSLITGDRVLVKNQSTASQNGIYVVATGSWTRASDFDGTASGEVEAGDFCFVQEGTTNGDTGWVLSTNGTITVGTTSLAFAQFSGSALLSSANNFTNTNTFTQIGVGTTSPTVLMHLHESSDTPARLKLSNSATGTGQTTDGLDIIMNGTANSLKANFINRENGEMGFWTNATERLTIKSNGDIDIGGTGSSARFRGDFSNASQGLRLTFQSSTTNGMTMVPATPNGTSTVSGFVAYSNSADSANTSYLQMRIDGSSGEARIASSINGTATSLPLLFYTGNTPTERLRISTSGAFGLAGANYGTSGQVLTSNGSNSAPSWQNAGSASAAGSSGQIQYNNSGSFAGAPMTTDGTNITLTGTAARIRGDFSNATHANRASFQTSTTNGSTAFQIIPNGTSTTSVFTAFGNSSDIANSAFAQFGIVGSSSEVRVASSRLGTGTSLPLVFYTGDFAERLRISENGAFGLAGANYGTSGQVLRSNGSSAPPSWATMSASAGGSSGEIQYNSSGSLAGAPMTTDGTSITLTGSSARIRGDFSNASQNARLSFQSSTTNGATVLQTHPNGTNQTSGFNAYTSSSDMNNSAFIQMQIIGATGEARVAAGRTGTASALPLSFHTGDSLTERLRIATNGAIGLSGANYGNAGQVLTSNGSSSSPSWQSITVGSAVPIISRAYLNATNVNTTNVGWQKIPLDTKANDDANIFNTTTRRFTPNRAGYYQVNLRARTNTTGLISLAVGRNGVQFIGVGGDYDSVRAAGGSTLVYCNGSTDYLELWGYFNAARTLTGGSNFDTWMEVYGPI